MTHAEPIDGIRSAREQSEPGGSESIDLLATLHRLWTWRYFLLANAIAAGIAAFASSYLVTPLYTSRATLLQSRHSDPARAAIQQFTSDLLPFFFRTDVAGLETYDNAVAILESRTAMERVARSFDLSRAYGNGGGTMDRTLRTLQDRTMFDFERNDNIALTVSDTNPKRAAAMADTFIAALNDITRDAGRLQARLTRSYLESRLDAARSELRVLEDTLRRFQDRAGIYALPQQTRMAVDDAASIQTEAAFADVETGIAERAFGAAHPMTRARRAIAAELRQRLRESNFGGGVNDSDQVALLYPFADAPRTGMRYASLTRDYRAQSGIVETLTRTLEHARLDEQRSARSVVVLDRPSVPEHRSSPMRPMIGAIFALAGLFLSAAAVPWMERARDGARIARLRRLYRVGV